MELNDIISIVEAKSKAVADEEIVKYTKQFPELNLTDEARDAVRQRALSQLTLQLSSFRVRSEDEVEEQFSQWFKANEEDNLRKACKHCLEDEAKKIRESAKGNMSSLDRYLKRHLGSAHTID